MLPFRESRMTQETQPLVVAYHRESGGDALTKYDLGVLAVRLAGLYFLAQAVTYASYLPGLWLYSRGGGQNWAMFASYSGPLVVNAVGGTLLMVRTGWIVRRVFPEFAADSALSATGRDLQAVALSVVGVWLVASAAPEAARLATQYWWGGSRVAYSNQQLDLIPNVVRVLAQVLVGLFLFARAKGLAALWHQLRTAGVARPPADSV